MDCTKRPSSSIHARCSHSAQCRPSKPKVRRRVRAQRHLSHFAPHMCTASVSGVLLAHNTLFALCYALLCIAHDAQISWCSGNITVGKKINRACFTSLLICAFLSPSLTLSPLSPLCAFPHLCRIRTTLSDLTTLCATGWIYFEFLFLFSGLEYTLSFLTHTRFNYSRYLRASLRWVMMGWR